MQDIDKNFFFKVVRASFGQRRKTLLNSLGSQPWLRGGKDILRQALVKLGKNENIRAEELSIEDFADLVREI